MTFRPRQFLQVAERLFAEGSAPSLRASVGRAYYSVYGELRLRVNAAHGRDVFGRSGRHADLVAALERSKRIARLGIHGRLNLLKSHRVDADYKPNAVIGRFEAEESLDTAAELIEAIDRLQTTDFKSVILIRKR